MAGIICICHSGLYAHTHHIFFSVFGVWLLSFLFHKLRKGRALERWSYIVCTNLVLVATAGESAWLYDQLQDQEHYSHFINPISAEPGYFAVTINDIPVRHADRQKIPVKIDALYQNHAWKSVSGKTFLYIPEGSSTFQLNDQLIIQGVPASVQKTGNPYEFDYGAFLKAHNIFHVFYLKQGSYYLAGKNTSWSLGNLGTQLKCKTVETLRESGLSQEAFSICAALLVGYDDEIDGDVMSVFSHSGTLHVLSVSGLHTGVLYAFIMWCFGLFDKHNRYKRLRCFTVILSMFLLVCITGFAPAVFRAAIMLSLVLVGKTFFRNGNPFNTLLLSAFILLLADPYLISDLGFLLSYMAVFGIMYLFPLLNRLYSPRYKPLKWLWESSVLSVSATLFTLPVSLYYFHQFPTWFLLSNLIIIPMSIGIMLLAILLLMVSKIALLKSWLVFIINKLTIAMIYLAGITDKPGAGYIDNIPFEVHDLMYCSVLIVLLLVSFSKKRFRYIALTGFIAISWLCVSIFSFVRNNEKSEVIVFKTRTKISLVIKHRSALYYLGDSLNPAENNRIIKPYLQHDLSCVYACMPGYNYFKTGDISLCCIKEKGSVRQLEALAPAILLIAGEAPCPDSTLSLKYTKRVIVAANTKNKTTEAWRKFCAEEGIRFHAIRHEGACIIQTFD